MIAGVLMTAWLAGQSGSDSCIGAATQLVAANQAIAGRDLAGAARVLDPLESEYRLCWKVMLVLGRLRYEKGEYLRANTYSELALLAAPEDPEALVLRAQLLSLQNQAPQARQFLEKACKLAPDNAEAHYQLGMLYDGSRRNPEAVSEFERVVRLRPNDARAYDYLALNLEPMGEIQRAEAAYQKALAVNQGPLADPFLEYNYGRLLCKLNRLAECQKRLDRALETAPATRAVYYEHARLNLRLDRLSDARVDAERALALPDSGGFILDLQVYNLLVQIYFRLGDQDAARKYARLSEAASVPIRNRERK
jgi:tetratricopeptide (TPR) repeat protein